MPSSRFIVPIRRGQPPSLFLVHSVAGELTWMPRLLEGLEPGRPLHGFAAPGLNSDAPFVSSLEAMAAAYLRDVREQQPRGPYLLGGYSMGGVVAFEMARQLEAGGEAAALLVLIDSFAPHPERVASIAAWSRNGLLMQVVANQLARQWGADELLPPQALRGAPYSEHSAVAARHLLAHARTRHKLEIQQTYLRRCQTLMRVHAGLLSSYRPHALARPPRTVLFRASRGLIGRDSALALPVLPDDERAPPHRWEPLLERHDTVDVDEEHFLLGGRQTMHGIGAALTPYLRAAALV